MAEDARHTHFVTVACDDLFARDIMDSAEVRGATYAVYTGRGIASLRNGSRRELHEALFGPSGAQERAMEVSEKEVR